MTEDPKVLPTPAVGIGLLGLGVVGSGVARILNEKRDMLDGMAGCPVRLEGVLVRDLLEDLHEEPAAAANSP